MKSPSVFLCPTGGNEKHGCFVSRAWNRDWKASFLTLVAVFLTLVTASESKAELLLMVRETNLSTSAVRTLSFSEGDSIYDSNLDIDDFIDADISAVESYFYGRWAFTSFFQAAASLGVNSLTGLPAEILNLQFEVKNVSGSSDWQLEILASYVGSNGSTDPSFLQMSGGGSSGQSPLEFKLLGAYSTDPMNTFYTNNYANESGPDEFVYTESPAIDTNNDWSSDEPTKSITSGSSLYAITHGVVIIGLADGNTFASQTNLEYVLPEPASIATWGVVAGLVGLARTRKRRVNPL